MLMHQKVMESTPDSFYEKIIGKTVKLNRIPESRASIRDLLKEADVRLPDVFSGSGKKEATKS